MTGLAPNPAQTRKSQTQGKTQGPCPGLALRGEEQLGGGGVGVEVGWRWGGGIELRGEES